MVTLGELLKAPLLIEFTLAGIVIDVRLRQSANALPSTSVTPSGMVTDVKLQP